MSIFDVFKQVERKRDYERVDVSRLPSEAMGLYLDLRERGWRDRRGFYGNGAVDHKDARMVRDETYTRALCKLVSLMETYNDFTVAGPPTDETRREMIQKLVGVRRIMGGDAMRVDEFLTVSPNYIVTTREPTMEEFNRIRSAKYPSWYDTRLLFVEYRMCFELYMTVPLFYGTRTPVTPRDDRTYTNRLLKEKGLRLYGREPDAYGDSYIGRITNMVVDFESRVATLMTGSAEKGDLFDITLSIRGEYVPEDMDYNYEEGDFVYPFVDKAVQRTMGGTEPYHPTEHPWTVGKEDVWYDVYYDTCNKKEGKE